MLGILGVVALVLGGFTAGGGAFDWEFLFSDGYREHGWVRSLGRDGARGLLILLGSVLLLVGFVTQVIDNASTPVTAVAGSPSTTGATTDDDEPTLSTDQPASRIDTDNSASAPSPRVAASIVGESDAPPASFGPTTESTSAAGVQPGPQPITIGKPEAVAEDADTLVMLQYRFEPGHRPLPGSRYFWIIDLLESTTEVESDGETLQKQGQLTHIFHTPLKGSGFERPWSTVLMVEVDGRREQVSNRLEITPGEGVRSKPLPAPTGGPIAPP